jgi:hypothetical protein
MTWLFVGIAKAFQLFYYAMPIATARDMSRAMDRAMSIYRLIYRLELLLECLLVLTKAIVLPI